MKIVVLWASPNQDGLTAFAKNQVLAGLTEKKAELEVIHLNECRLNHCSACGNGWGDCKAKGCCVQQDDFEDIYSALAGANGFVIVTPVYWHDLAENLKALLDRMRRCDASHNHWLKGKPGLLVACAGGSGRGATQCLCLLEDTLSHMGALAFDRLPITRANRDYMQSALCSAGKAFVNFLTSQSAQ